MRRLRSRRLLAIVLCLLDAPTFAQVTQNVPMGIYQDQVAGWINVKSYGATGNGVTDDTAALQRALTAGANRYAPSINMTSTCRTIPRGLETIGLFSSSSFTSP